MYQQTLEVSGFAPKSGLRGEMIAIDHSGIVFSDSLDFFQKMNSLIKLTGLNFDYIYSLLVLIDENNLASIYINNEIKYTYDVKINKKKDKGEAIHEQDMDDIYNFHFLEIDIKKNHKIIFYKKIGLRYFLYYNLGRDLGDKTKDLDVKEMYQTLTDGYRYLFFYDILKILEHQNYEIALSHGRFPYIAIIREYKSLLSYYDEPSQERIDKFKESFVDNYDSKIDQITEKRWSNKVFKEKHEILETGLNLYKQATKEGYIGAIKTLTSEIEGIIKGGYIKSMNFSKNSQKKGIKEYVNELKYQGRDIHINTIILLYERFESFLVDYFFRESYFNDEGRVDFSRHSVDHGTLTPDKYTKEIALQVIFALDQLYYFTD